MRHNAILWILLSFIAFNAFNFAGSSERPCDYSILDDVILMELISGADDKAAGKAFEEIWERHKAPVTGYIVNQLKRFASNQLLVEELLSNTMVSAWKSFAKGNYKVELAGAGGVRGYLMRVAFSQVQLHFQAHKIRERNAVTTLDQVFFDGTTAERNFEAQAEPTATNIPKTSLPGQSQFNAEMLLSILEESISEADMKDLVKEILRLHIIQKMSFSDISKKLGVHFTTVKYHWNNGLNELRSYLENNGLDFEKLMSGEITDPRINVEGTKKNTKKSPQSSVALTDVQNNIRTQILNAYKNADLTLKMKSLIKLKIFKGMSYLEIAQELNSSEANIRQNFYDVAEKIEAFLKDSQLTYEKILNLDLSKTTFPTDADFGEELTAQSLVPDEFLKNVVDSIKNAGLIPRNRKIVILRLFYKWSNPDVMQAYNMKRTAASAAFTTSIDKMAKYLERKGISSEHLQNAQFNLSEDEIKELFKGGRAKAGKLSPQEFRSTIELALKEAKLSERQASIARFYMFDHLTAPEIALKMNLSSARVSSEFIEARFKMSKFLTEHEVTEEDLLFVDFTLPEVEWNPARYEIHVAKSNILNESPDDTFEKVLLKYEFSERLLIILRLHVIHHWCFQNIAEALNISVESTQAYLKHAIDKMSVELSSLGFNVITIKSDHECFAYKAKRRPPFPIPDSIKDMGSQQSTSLNPTEIRHKVALALAATKDLSDHARELVQLRIIENVSTADLVKKYGILDSSIRLQIERATRKMSPQLESQGISREHIAIVLHDHN
jgi:RNA polymerase sigma factor (sigma-70 family)